MYTPKFNQVTDRNILIETMRANSFAILFGPLGNAESQVATHLPLVVQEDGEHGLLEGHFAKANPHWRALAGRETLVVFPGTAQLCIALALRRTRSLSPLGTTSPFTFTARSNSSSKKQKNTHSLTDSSRRTTPPMPTNGIASPMAIEALCLRASLVSVFRLLASKGNSS